MKLWPVHFGELVMFLFIPVQIWLGVLIASDRKKNIIKPFDACVREHDRNNAIPLTGHSAAMLEYARDSLKRQSDRAERRLTLLIGKDTAIVALFGLAVASTKSVGDVTDLLTRLNIHVAARINSGLVVATVFSFVIFIIAASLTIRLKILKKAYASDVLEIALRLKTLEMPPPIALGGTSERRYHPIPRTRLPSLNSAKNS